MLSSHLEGNGSGVACPGCFLGAEDSRAPRIPLKPCGVGIKDGRGYGPYHMGYYRSWGRWLPYGPNCERLGAAYDYTPGRTGEYIPLYPPRRTVGIHQVPQTPNAEIQMGLTEGTRDFLAATGFSLAALGLGVAIWTAQRDRYKPRRRRRYAMAR
jgi:hypothetical protein